MTVKQARHLKETRYERTPGTQESKIIFGGEISPSFLRVNNVSVSVFNEMENSLINIRGREGSIDNGVLFREKIISVNVSLVYENVSVFAIARELQRWLQYGATAELVFTEDSDVFYNARIYNTIQIDDLLTVGKGEITFLVADGIAWRRDDVEFSHTFTDAAPTKTIEVGGRAVYPAFTITAGKNDTSIVLENDRGGKLTIGNIDAEATTQDLSPLILADTFTNLNNVGTAIALDGAKITDKLTLTYKGVDLSPPTENGKYKWTNADATKWNYAAGLITLPKQLTNFKVGVNFIYKNTDPKALATMEVHLLDAANSVLARTSLRDASNKARDTSFRMYLQDQHKKTFNNDGTISMDTMQWARVTIERMNGLYTFTLSDLYDNGKSRIIKQWTYKDAKNEFTKVLSKIQLSIGSYKTFPSAEILEFTHLHVEEYLNGGATTAPVIIKTGDVIHVDTYTATLTKNGEPFFKELAPSSEFFNLQTGTNVISLTPGHTAKIVYKERY